VPARRGSNAAPARAVYRRASRLFQDCALADSDGSIVGLLEIGGSRTQLERLARVGSALGITLRH